MKKKIYIVEKHTGMMGDKHITPVISFVSEEKAKEYADNLNNELAEVFAKCCNEVEDNAVYSIRILCDKYLEENYPDIWKKMNDETNNEDDILWSQIGDIEYEFEKDNDEVIAYAREKIKDGLLTEKDIEDIINFYAYNDTLEFDGYQPFYSVAKAIELVEDED